MADKPTAICLLSNKLRLLWCEYLIKYTNPIVMNTVSPETKFIFFFRLINPSQIALKNRQNEIYIQYDRLGNSAVIKCDLPGFWFSGLPL